MRIYGGREVSVNWSTNYLLRKSIRRPLAWKRKQWRAEVKLQWLSMSESYTIVVSKKKLNREARSD